MPELCQPLKSEDTFVLRLGRNVVEPLDQRDGPVYLAVENDLNLGNPCLLLCSEIDEQKSSPFLCSSAAAWPENGDGCKQGNSTVGGGPDAMW